MEPERPEGNGDGQESQGLRRGGAAGVVARARAQGVALKERAEAEAKGYKDPQQTQLWKSIFRVSHDRSDPRNRSPGHPLERLPAPPPGEDQPRRRALRVHVGHGRHHLLPLHRADLHRRAADVLLPPDEGAGVPRHSLPRTRRAVRQAPAEHAPLGGAPDGDHDVAAHVPRGADRLLQASARVQLVRRRGAAGADAAALVHRISAAGRSARLLGGDGGDEHGARDADAGERRARSARSSG